MGYREERERRYEYDRTVDYYKRRHGLDDTLSEIMADRELEGRMDNSSKTETWNTSGSWGGSYNH